MVQIMNYENMLMVAGQQQEEEEEASILHHITNAHIFVKFSSPAASLDAIRVLSSKHPVTVFNSKINQRENCGILFNISM